MKPVDRVDADDEIIKEVRRARQKMFEEAGGTLDGLFKMLKEFEKREKLQIVNLPPRRLSPSDTSRVGPAS
jgi:hypothetical protein